MTDFSIIIPAYNNIALITKTISSIISQEGITYELIIVDDSTDDVICNYIKKSRFKNIKYFKNTPKKGAVPNWNFGLSLAQGKYISVLHHDESYVDDQVQLKTILHLLNNGNDVIVSKILVQESNGNTYSLRFPEVLKNFILSYFPSFLFFFNFIGPVSCITFHRRLVKDFDPQLKWLVDIEWYYRLFSKSKISYVRSLQVLSILDHKEKITNNINIHKELIKDMKRLKSKYGPFSLPYILSRIKQLTSAFLKSAPKKTIRL